MNYYISLLCIFELSKFYILLMCEILSLILVDDAVYMSNSKDRQEYVLSDVGKIFLGSHKKPVGRPWVYGQVIIIII